MTSAKHAFKTDNEIRKLKKPSKRTFYADKLCPGLQLVVQPTGNKSFIWWYRDAFTKKSKRHTIGPYPAISLADARQELERLKLNLRTTGKVQTTNQTKTVADLFDKYYSTQAVTTLKRPDAYKQIIDHDIIPSIGHENLVSLEHRRYLLSDIVDRAITRGATTHANKIRSLLKRTFKWAYQRGYIHYDPTIALEKSAYNGIKDNSREVALDTTSGEANEELTEIPRLFKALDDNKRLSQQVRTGAKLLLLTGLRVSELRLAKRSDLADNILTIPIGNQKLPPRLLPSAKPFHVPLSTYAMHLLKEPSGTFLLGGEKPISDKAIGRAIKRLQASGKLKTREFEARDLRRTFRTHIGSLGVPLEVAESCLNHKQPVIIRTYDTQSYLPQRGEALQVWSDRVEMAITNFTGEQ